MENHGALKAGLAVRQRSYISPAVSSAFERALPFGVRGFGSRPFPLLSDCCSQREWEATIRGQIGARLGVRGKQLLAHPYGARGHRLSLLIRIAHGPSRRREQSRCEGPEPPMRTDRHRGGRHPCRIWEVYTRGGDTSEPLRGVPKTEKGGRAF